AGIQGSAFNWEEELPIQDDLQLLDPSNKRLLDPDTKEPLQIPGPKPLPSGAFKKPSKLYPGLRTVRDAEWCLGFKNSVGELQPFELLSEGLKFTAKTSNHLFGLGEFFASYLFVWSDKVWPGLFRDPKFALEFAALKTVFDAEAKKKKADG